MDQSTQAQLLDLAKQSIQHGLTQNRPLPITLSEQPPLFQKPGATFVTLTQHKALRGCIGSLIARQPLVVDLVDNAFNAAFRDHRFAPLTEQEFPTLTVHISLLSAPEPITSNSEDDLFAQLRPGIDGLILKEGLRSSTFLPSVWEELATKQAFLQQLKLKAGLPKDYWSSTLQFSRYTVEYWGDPESSA